MKQFLKQHKYFILAFLIFVILAIVSGYQTLKISNFKFQIKIITIVIILGLSWFTTFTYASGPDLRVVSKDEFEAAKYIFPPLVGEGRVGLCVLADTWVLLPLEALSKGQIVGGGFPIDYNFAQPERTVLFNEMINNPRASVLKLAHEKTGAGECWFVSGIQNAEFRMQNDKLFGMKAVEVGDLLVWKETTFTPVVAPLKKGKK